MTNTFDAMVEAALKNRGTARVAPVDQWDPPLSGEIGINIGEDGRWYHEGVEIKRSKIVELFASILKREGEHYFLVTPLEKWEINVADAPFFAIEMEQIQRDGEQALLFTTLTQDSVIADDDHPISVHQNAETHEPRPYIKIRGGMWAKISRNVYYELAQLAEPVPTDPEKYQVSSMGVFFTLA